MRQIIAWVVLLLGAVWLGCLFWVAPAFGWIQVGLIVLAALMKSPHVTFFVIGMFFGFRR